MMTTRSLATGAHLENRGFRCGPPRSQASSPQHAFRFELRIGNAGQNRRDWGFMMGVRSIGVCGRFPERRRGGLKEWSLAEIGTGTATQLCIRR